MRGNQHAIFFRGSVIERKPSTNAGRHTSRNAFFCADGTLRTQVITAVLALLGIVGAYWLGTSFSSQRKTELQAGGAKLPGV